MKMCLAIIGLLLIVAFSKAQKPQGTTVVNAYSASFSIAERMPEFPGGMKAFYKFVKKTMRWPESSMEVYGSVFVTFIVEKNGKLSNFKILRGLNNDMDNEAIRILKLSPDWIPGKNGKQTVRTKHTVPVRFRRD